MFEVGFTEILVIFVIALVVLGPEKLPKLARQAGNWMGRARAMARQLRNQLDEEVDLAQSMRPTPAPQAPSPPPPQTPTPPGSAQSP
jgi:sec-independent protein translocase protein TatB